MADGASGCLELEGDVFDGLKSLLLGPASWAIRPPEPTAERHAKEGGAGVRGRERREGTRLIK